MARPLGRDLRSADERLAAWGDWGKSLVGKKWKGVNFRIEFIKLIHQKAESARVVLRNLREESLREIQKEEKDGQLTEDDKYQGEKDLNKLIENENNRIKTAIDAKEKDLKTV